MPFEIISKILLFNSTNHSNILKTQINEYNKYLLSDDFIFFNNMGVKKISFYKYTLKRNRYNYFLNSSKFLFMN